MTVYPSNALPLDPNGPFQAVRGLRLQEITDGLSQTIFVGEKHVPFDSLGYPPWDCGVFDGHNPGCNTRCGGPGFPLAQSIADPGVVFGSTHPGTCQFVFGDGRIQAVMTTIDPTVLGMLCQRNDGQAVPEY